MSDEEYKIVHVSPVNDAIQHELQGHDCICGPRVQLGPKGRAIIHHSMDGREIREREEKG